MYIYIYIYWCPQAPLIAGQAWPRRLFVVFRAHEDLTKYWILVIEVMIIWILLAFMLIIIIMLLTIWRQVSVESNGSYEMLLVLSISTHSECFDLRCLLIAYWWQICYVIWYTDTSDATVHNQWNTCTKHADCSFICYCVAVTLLLTRLVQGGHRRGIVNRYYCSHPPPQ